MCFSVDEDAALEEGVRVFGMGSWKQIFEWGIHSGSGSGSMWKAGREPGALKDRWRNMGRARNRLRQHQQEWEVRKFGSCSPLVHLAHQRQGGGAGELTVGMERLAVQEKISTSK